MNTEQKLVSLTKKVLKLEEKNKVYKQAIVATGKIVVKNLMKNRTVTEANVKSYVEQMNKILK